MDHPMPLHCHLEEARVRILRASFFVVLFSALSFYWMDTVLEVLKRPAGNMLSQLAVFSPTAAVLSFIKISVSAGLIFSVPILLWETWMFVRPALEERAARKGIVFVGAGSALFLAGALFSYFFLLPASLKFLLSIGKEDLLFMISLDAYVSFVLVLIFGGGIIFEMPLVIYLLAKAGILTSGQMLQGWKAAVLLILVAAAFLTPTPDAVNMMLMAVPMAVLYLLSIYVAKWAEKKHCHSGRAAVGCLSRNPLSGSRIGLRPSGMTKQK